MKKYFYFLLLFFICNNVWAEHYPKQGETIAFLPVIDKVKAEISGYDCFFYTKKVYKNNKFKFNDKYRVNVNADKLTPYEEIEGHIFIVVGLKSWTSKVLGNLSTIFLLKREDGVEITMRVPHIDSPYFDCNILTKSMAGYSQIPTSSLSIPCYNVEDYRQLLSLQGTEVTNKNGDNCFLNNHDFYLAQNEMTNATTQLNGNPIEGFSKWNLLFTIETIQFEQVSGYKYKQLVANCTKRGRKFKMPVFPFRTIDFDALFKFSRNLSANYSINDLLSPSSIKYNYFAKRYDNIVRLKNKKIYYGLKDKYTYTTYNRNYISNSHDLWFRVFGTKNTSKLKDGFYELESFCLDNVDNYNSSVEFCAVIKNDKGTKIIIPIKYYKTIQTFTSASETLLFDFENIFCTEEEAKAKLLQDDLEEKKRLEH